MTNALQQALISAGVAQAPTPAPVRKAERKALPAEVLDQAIIDLSWAEVVTLLGMANTRVYLKVDKAEVVRVMDAFSVNEGRIVEVRVQGEEDYRSFDATSPVRVIVVTGERGSAKKAAPVDRKRDRKAADRAYRASVKGSNPAAAKFGNGKRK